MSRYHLSDQDAVAWLKTLASESVDLVVTDPAYESLEKHRAKGTTTRLKVSEGSSNEWFSIFKNERFPELLAELYRVLKPNAHLYVLSDQETMMDVVRPMGRDVGFTFWKFLVWDKAKIGMGYHWRNRHEVISFLEKGKRRLHDLGEPDVLECPRVVGGYPTEKPVALLERLILNSSDHGDLVIDPFGGSFSCGEAALRSGRDFAGCDVKPSAIDNGVVRLAQHGELGLVVRGRREPSQGSLFG
jgi:site-specific DNA-methyltransferase (adenine-specific)